MTNAKRFTIVQKFGGTSLGTPQKIKAVAHFIKDSLDSCQNLCVVVSAMGHTTDELLALAKDISPNPPKRELDMLISCGERTSMALLAMALNDIGVKALSLTGSQSGIITDDNHSQAKITAIKPIRVLEAFKHYQVVIVAGFQGVSDKKEITTLERGGSDTTAIAMAYALSAEACEIYSDVDGLMSADPNIVANAKVLSKVSLAQMTSMALYGARVLAYDAAMMAKKYNIAIMLNKTCGSGNGTKVENSDDMAEHKFDLLAITHMRSVVRIKMPIINFNQLTDYFLCAYANKDDFIAYLCNDFIKNVVDTSTITKGFALISLHVSSLAKVNILLAKAYTVLAQRDIVIFESTISNKIINLAIKDVHVESALNILHDELITSLGA